MLTYEEILTVLLRIEAYLNSRPLVPMLANNDEGVGGLNTWPYPVGQPLSTLSESDEGSQFYIAGLSLIT